MIKYEKLVKPRSLYKEQLLRNLPVNRYQQLKKNVQKDHDNVKAYKENQRKFKMDQILKMDKLEKSAAEISKYAEISRQAGSFGGVRYSTGEHQTGRLEKLNNSVNFHRRKRSEYAQSKKLEPIVLEKIRN